MISWYSHLMDSDEAFASKQEPPKSSLISHCIIFLNPWWLGNPPMNSAPPPLPIGTTPCAPRRGRPAKVHLESWPGRGSPGRCWLNVWWSGGISQLLLLLLLSLLYIQYIPWETKTFKIKGSQKKPMFSGETRGLQFSLPRHSWSDHAAFSSSSPRCPWLSLWRSFDPWPYFMGTFRDMFW